MVMITLKPFLRYVSTWILARSSFGPVSTEFHGFTLLSHIENPSWCSATGPTNQAPASRNSCAQASGSQAPPLEINFGANCTNLPDLSFAPRRNLSNPQFPKGSP